MDKSKIAQIVNTDPVVQILMEEPIPMRLAYVGLDGYPRTIPVHHLWDGTAFVFASPNAAYKVKAITANPKVAFTVDVGNGRPAVETRERVTAVIGAPPPAVDFGPISMHGRGTATVEITSGVPQEHIDASRRMVCDDAKWEAWARARREEKSGMALIRIEPTHLVVVDFVTRFPPPTAINNTAHGQELVAAPPQTEQMTETVSR